MKGGIFVEGFEGIEGLEDLVEQEKKELAKACYCYKEVRKTCKIRLMFYGKFDRGGYGCKYILKKFKNLPMEQNVSVTEVPMQKFENKVLRFLVLEKQKRGIEDLKKIVQSARDCQYNICYRESSFYRGLILLICELYGLLNDNDKTFKNLYDLLLLEENYHEDVVKKLEFWFGKEGAALREFGDEMVNVENIFKYVNFGLNETDIFCCLKRSDITEKVILDYINRLAPEEHSDSEEYRSRIPDMHEMLDFILPTSVYKIRNMLAKFKEQSNFCKLVIYKYLDKCYREDLAIFRQLPMKCKHLYIEELNLGDRDIGIEVYKLLGARVCLWHISLFDKDVQNTIFKNLEEKDRRYCYSQLSVENRNLDNLLLLPEFERCEYFKYMGSKYRIAENLKYVNSSSRGLIFAYYLTPQETTYDNFVKYLNYGQKKEVSLLGNVKIYEEEVEEMICYYDCSSTEGFEEREALLKKFKGWYRKFREDEKNKNKRKKNTKEKETNDIKLIGKKLKSDSQLDTEKQSAKKIPKLENNFHQNENNKDGHEQG